MPLLLQLVDVLRKMSCFNCWRREALATAEPSFFLDRDISIELKGCAVFRMVLCFVLERLSFSQRRTADMC